MKDIVYWIWLSMAVTPGTDTFVKLKDKIGGPKEIYDADEDEIKACIGSRSRDFQALADKELSEAIRISEFCESKKVGILTYNDDSFPQALRNIDTPPVLLYYRGIIPDFNSECMVSIVGTRRLTDYGRRNAFTIGYDLATAGAVIVSGMAIGIDGVSHAGSISASGINVAFLGSGIDVCYPEHHKRLAKEIVKNGCVMTEYAPGTKPEKIHFPARNRLIAGISAATVVIEGRERSGAIITARYAKKFNKMLYALPGNVDNKTSEVTNLLIKNGAKLITSADDIVSDLEFVFLGRINPFKLTENPEVDMFEAFRTLEIACVTPSDDIFSRFPSRKSSKKIQAEEQIASIPSIQQQSLPEELPKRSIDDMNYDSQTLEIYEKIPGNEPCSIDSLSDSGIPMKQVMKALFKLEMGKFIVMLPGEKVKRNF